MSRESGLWPQTIRQKPGQAWYKTRLSSRTATTEILSTGLYHIDGHGFLLLKKQIALIQQGLDPRLDLKSDTAKTLAQKAFATALSTEPLASLFQNFENPSWLKAAMWILLLREKSASSKRKSSREQKHPRSSERSKVVCLFAPTTEITKHCELFGQVFPNWRDHGLNKVLENVLTLDEASRNKSVLAMWQGVLPVVTVEELCCDVPNLIGKVSLSCLSNITGTQVKQRDFILTSNDDKIRGLGTSIFQLNLSPREMLDQDPFSVANVFVEDVPTLDSLAKWASKHSIHQVFPKDGLSFNITPAGTFTDIHADSCTVGTAVCFGKCAKVWILFPGSQKNLDLWSSNLGLYGGLARYGSKLEGGIIVRTSNDPADLGNRIDMPAGTLHAVCTTQGGLLGGVNYTTSEDLLLASQMICRQLRREQFPDQLAEDLRWYVLTVPAALAKCDEQVYPSIFYGLASILAEIDKFPNRYPLLRRASNRKAGEASYYELQQMSADVWKDWQSKYQGSDGKVFCICGIQYESFRVHYMPGTEISCRHVEYIMHS